MSGTSKTILLTNNDIASSDIAFSSQWIYWLYRRSICTIWWNTRENYICSFRCIQWHYHRCFYHKLNPNKEMDNITGAVVAGIGAGWIGGKAGFFWVDQQERQLELLQALLQALYGVMIYTILLTKNLILLNLIVLLRLNAKAQQI